MFLTVMKGDIKLNSFILLCSQIKNQVSMFDSYQYIGKLGYRLRPFEIQDGCYKQLSYCHSLDPGNLDDTNIKNLQDLQTESPRLGAGQTYWAIKSPIKLAWLRIVMVIRDMLLNSKTTRGGGGCGTGVPWYLIFQGSDISDFLWVWYLLC